MRWESVEVDVSRCFVLGAGFSKAVAGLPLSRELLSDSDRIAATESKLSHGKLSDSIFRVFDLLKQIEYESLHIPFIGNRNGRVTWSNISEKIEEILTFVDLNRMSEFRGLIDVNGESSNCSRAGPWYHYNLADVRPGIEYLLYRKLLILPPYAKHNLLDRFIDLIMSGDSIITFNYDIVLEHELYSRKRWHPSDGYQLKFDESDVGKSAPRWSSKMFIHKLHGSVNWARKGPMDNVLDEPELNFNYYYPIWNEAKSSRVSIFHGWHPTQDPLVSQCLSWEVDPPFELIQGCEWVLPSFVKIFDNSEIVSVWRNAADALRASDEIVVIGYSFPIADSAAQALLATAGLSHKRASIVDLKSVVENVGDRFAQIAGRPSSGSDTVLYAGDPTENGRQPLENYLRGQTFHP